MFQEVNEPDSLQMMLVDGLLPWSPNKENKILELTISSRHFSWVGAWILCSFLWSRMILLSCSKFVPANSFSSIFLVKLLAPLPHCISLSVCLLCRKKRHGNFKACGLPWCKQKAIAGYLKIRCSFPRDDDSSAFLTVWTSNGLFVFNPKAQVSNMTM